MYTFCFLFNENNSANAPLLICNLFLLQCKMLIISKFALVRRNLQADAVKFALERATFTST